MIGRLHRFLVAAAVLGLAGGCGNSEQQKQAEEGAKKMQEGAQTIQQAAQQAAQSQQQQMAQGMQQMAQGFQQMAQGSAKVVDYEQLKALLPEMGGWTRTDAKGEQVSMPISTSRAEAHYQKDDGRLELDITDTALSQLLLAPIQMFMTSGFSERSDDGFKRAARVGGQPGYEEWNAKSKHGEVTAVVANRFIVNAKGDDMDSIDTVRKLVESVDLGKLGSLK